MAASSSSSQHGWSVSVPEKVVSEILSWMPVKSLLRFKSVCKSWYHLIESSFFINHHLRRHHHNNHTLFVLNTNHVFDTYIHGLHFSLLSSCNNFEFSKEIILPILSQAYDTPMEIVICNGIVCLYYRPSYGIVPYHDIPSIHVFLWNPATKHFRALPRPASDIRKPDAFDTHFEYNIGFGFDIIRNDYKLVLISKHNYATGFQVQLYSLTTNSWTTLHGVFPDDRVAGIFSNPNAPYKNETYCWFGGSQTRANDYCVLSFDFIDHKFQTTPLPDALTSVRLHQCPKFTFVRGNIACITKLAPFDDIRTPFFDDISVHFEVWVLNEYPVKESWTKLYTIGPFQLHDDPKGILGDRFFLFSKGNQLCIYDVVTGETKSIPAEKYQSFFFTNFAKYNESLVSIKGRDDDASEDSSDWISLLPKRILPGLRI